MTQNGPNSGLGKLTHMNNDGEPQYYAMYHAVKGEGFFLYKVRWAQRAYAKKKLAGYLTHERVV